MTMREGHKHNTGYGLAYIDPRGDHWAAYFVADVKDHRVPISRIATGETAVDALVRL
jgi:hypothetical protein